MRSENQVVIITGAAGGIGKHLAMGYVQAGARVVLADVDRDGGEQLQSELGHHSIFVPVDVRNPADIEHLMNKTMESFGRIDVLVNNAGVSRWKDPLEMSVEEWDDILNINLRGYFLCAREAARYMKENESGGSIINIASTRSLMSEANSEAYAASKGGIVALTHALAVSLGSYRIRVNAVSPGWIETGDQGGLREIDHHQHPAQRVGKPQDILKACFYLSDPENDFVTGENLVVDGGMTKKMIYEE